MAQYDLTTSMSRFLDRHLILPILETLEMKQIYPLDELLPTKVELLSKTNMVDFHMDVYKKLHKLEDASADVLAGNADLQAMEQRKIQVVASLEKISADAADILGITVENSQLAANLRAEKKFTVEYLMENYELTEQQIDALYHYAKANYEIGNYAVAADCLFQYIPLSCASPSRQKEFYSALWGKFASEILMQNWDVALEDLNRLRELLLTKTYGTPEEQLQQRTWLIHWSLFVFFNHPAGRNGIVDMFFQDKYLNTIQTNCPHVLRYLVAAVIIYKKRRNMIKDMVRVLQQDPVAHQDPVIQFLECLFVHFDFDKAQQKLRDCEELLNTDYFLAELREDFIENARILMFETYCRIHQCIDIKMLAEKLNMNLDEAERWIVNLIRNARLDAKIDSAQGRVIMGTQYPSLYQQVIDKTKALSYRTFVMANTIARQEV